MEEKYLQLLSKEYPNIKRASAEIINLSAILSLPKGTEYYFSDLHGEHEAFIHMLKSASGVIRGKIDEIFGKSLSERDRESLGALIYNSESEIKKIKAGGEDFDEWCKVAIYQLVEICKSVSSKYTRSKVRKRLPESSGYIMDELLHADDGSNKVRYYSEIINSIIECDMGEAFINQLAKSIGRLTVDRLHIIGDIYDRGPHPDTIMDFLMDFHDVDIQWGNHDIVWMGAATGNWACITNVIRQNMSYNNFDMLEVGYGINLRPLAVFASEIYKEDPCELFAPHTLDENKFDKVDDQLVAKMHKAITIIQFKVEGMRIMAHPEYGMQDRLLLDKIDFQKGTVKIGNQEYVMQDNNFPTIDPQNPYELTKKEKDLLNTIEASFLHSDSLQRHVRFLFSHGAMYMKINGNLLYHGCVPMRGTGDFESCTINGATHQGKRLLDYLDQQVRKAYFNPSESDETGRSGDIMWYLWLGSKSPLFGKDKMATFERIFVKDKITHKEKQDPYYRLINGRETCEKILEEFGLDPASSRILNGHVPVKIKDGESPIKGDGLLYIIDGGMSKAYQKTTGIAGYTFISSSKFMALTEHFPYSPMDEKISYKFKAPTIKTVETFEERICVRDTDIGQELKNEIVELKKLVDAYKKGIIKESN